MWTPRDLWARLRLQPVAAVMLSLAVAMHLLAVRTYYYTGRLDMFYGTPSGHLSTVQPGKTLGVTLSNIAGSVLVLVTMQDPPRFRSAGADSDRRLRHRPLVANRAPGFRALPFAPSAWCLGPCRRAGGARHVLCRPVFDPRHPGLGGHRAGGGGRSRPRLPPHTPGGRG